VNTYGWLPPRLTRSRRVVFLLHKRTIADPMIPHIGQEGNVQIGHVDNERAMLHTESKH
jgi:hypothetical protein